jgi:penicillin-insensitive murein endopeptidase
MRRPTIALFVLCLFPAVAVAAPRRTARVESGAAHIVPTPAGGLSVGSPTDGHLVGGAHLDESPWLRVTPCYQGQDVRWGLESLVSLIDHGARSVRKEFPDAVLSVGHLSRRGGGDVDRHASHESGRDADVGFYVTNQQGKAIYAEHFVPFLGDGTAPSWPGARFDDARNWAFVASVVADGRARVSYLFVASPLRARLLAYAQKIGAPYAVRVRASELMAQPRGSLPHDDHFHVRISCPSFMEACVEFPTRNLARAKLPRLRSRGDQAAPSATAHATTSPSPVAAPSSRSSAPPAPRVPTSAGRIGSDEERYGAVGSAPAVPIAPEIDPPAALDVPIDDVDGVVQ